MSKALPVAVADGWSNAEGFESVLAPLPNYQSLGAIVQAVLKARPYKLTVFVDFLLRKVHVRNSAGGMASVKSSGQSHTALDLGTFGPDDVSERSGSWHRIGADGWEISEPGAFTVPQAIITRPKKPVHSLASIIGVCEDLAGSNVPLGLVADQDDAAVWIFEISAGFRELFDEGGALEDVARFEQTSAPIGEGPSIPLAFE